MALEKLDVPKEETLEDIKFYIKIHEEASARYTTLALQLVKKNLFLERRYDRRFLYPEEYI